MTIRIIVLGPPGAGKGTQCALLAQRLGVPHISTGEMMREAKANKDELGEIVKSYLVSGTLVPDSVVTRVVRTRLEKPDCKVGFILDGYPRTAAQAHDLKGMADLVGPITHAIDLIVPDQLLIDRIVKRGQDGSGRADDTAELARKRLEIYRQHTLPVSDFYKDLGVLICVDGVGEVTEVTQRVLAVLKVVEQCSG